MRIFAWRSDVSHPALEGEKTSDKAMPVKRKRGGQAIGRVREVTLMTVTRNLAVFLGMG
jgi:hypothetical protein